MGKASVMKWNWGRAGGEERGDDEVQLALLHEEAIASASWPSAWAHSRPSLSGPCSLTSSSPSPSSSSESLLYQEEHASEGPLPSPHKARRNSTSSRRRGCAPIATLVRVPASLGLYVQLQIRYRFGITLALPGNPFARKFPFPSRRRSSCGKYTYVLWCIYALSLIPFLLLLGILVYGGIPPSYSDIRAAERALPQHHWDWDRWKGGKSKGRGDGHLVHGEFEERFLRFPDHLWGHGLNNVLQEAILTSHLTLSSNRTPVFEDYTWSHLRVPYTLYDFSLRPTRIPLGAFVGGVLGGHEGVNDVVGERRAVSAAYFEYACPPSEVIEVVYRSPNSSDELSTEENEGEEVEGVTTTNEPQSSSSSESPTSTMSIPSANTLGSKPYRYPKPFPSWDADGNEIIEWFEKRLAEPDVRDKRCVVVREERRVFDSNFFGSNKILSLFPGLLSSPVLKQFQWSALVMGAVEKNVQRFFGSETASPSTIPPSDVQPVPILNDNTSRNIAAGTISPSPSANQTLPGVLAVHLRRGDYKRHCIRLKEWASGYMGLTGVLSDHFDRELGLPRGSEAREPGTEESEEERDARRQAYYLEHCLPSVEQVMLRLREVREEYDNSLRAQSQLDIHERNTKTATDAEVDITAQRNPKDHALRDVYVLTNGWPSFMEELREALMEDGWERVVGTPDWEGTAPTLRFTAMDGRKVEVEELDREERGVSAAIDMGIAQRAEVFVGNGFSSLSSNIIMLRLAKGLAVNSNRLL